MFDIGWSELILVVVVALVVIGPNDMPKALYEAGRWLRQFRLLASEFHHGLGELMREAELQDLRHKAEAAAREAELLGTLPASVQELMSASRLEQSSYDPGPYDPGRADFISPPPADLPPSPPPSQTASTPAATAVTEPGTT